MVVLLNNSLIKTLNLKSIKYNVKIIKVKNDSSLILFQGKKIEIPYKLDLKKKYIAEFKNNKLIINEKKILKKNIETKLDFIKKDDFLKKLDFIIENNDGKKNIFEKIIKYFNFFQIYSKINKENDKNQKKQYYFNKNNDENFYFVFNLPFYESPSKIFIKISNKKDVYINIFTEKKNNKNYEEYLSELKKRLKNISRNSIINFSTKKDEFYNIIYNNIKKKSIDMKV